MTLVIWRIEILPIPAGRKDYSCSDTLRAVLVRQLTSIFGIAWSEALAVSKTAVADRDSVALLGRGVSSDHTEAGFEGCHFVVLGAVGHVVHRHPSVLLEPDIGVLGNALESAVLGGLEVQGGGPVIAEVLRVSARCAGRLGGWVIFGWFHLSHVSGSLQRYLCVLP
jgi:hypothetical protein